MILMKDRATLGIAPKVLVTRGDKYAPSKHGFIMVVTGSPTEVTLTLHGSTDDDVPVVEIQSYTLTAPELLAGGEIPQFLVDMPLDYLAIEIVSMTGGTAPTVSVYHTGGY